MNSHGPDVSDFCSIIGLYSDYPLSLLAGMEKPAPVSTSNALPDTRISSVSVSSKDSQVHPLAVGTMVPSDVITHITTALTLGSSMRSNLPVPKQGKKKKCSAIQETQTAIHK